MKEKYHFIHITKSGGSCFYFNTTKAENYSDFIEFDRLKLAHELTCAEVDNPIVIVRDVESRFYSMYRYWKYGSELWPRSIEKLEQTLHYSILDFIELLENGDMVKITELSDNETIWFKHFLPSSHWIKEKDYSKTVVVRYQRDLNEQFQKLFRRLGFDINANYPKINASRPDSSEKIWENNKAKINEFISKYFEDDIKLINSINSNPSLFRLVI